MTAECFEVDRDRENALSRQQAVLAEFGELALRSDDLDEILQQACRLIGEALGTDLAKVMELQEDRRTLLVRAGIGWPPGIVGQMTVKAEETSSEGHALQTGKPVISTDIETETRFHYADFIRQAGVKALMNVIIIGAENMPPYGLLQVDSRHPRVFTETDTEFLRAYANLLAAAVNRLRSLHAVHRWADALRDSEARLRTLVESMPQLVWRSASNGAWTWASPQWSAFTGQSVEASRGHGWLDVLHPADRAPVQAAWRDASGGSEFHADYRVLHAPSGRYCWFQSRGMPVRDGDGLVIEWIGTSTDIDDQMQARAVLARGSEELETLVAERTADLQQALSTLQDEVRERERAQEQLRQSEKLKAIGQLTGGIAHDFNNMLQAFSSTTSMVRHRLQQGRISEVPAYIDRAETVTRRAAALTQRLLAFARKQALVPETVDLDQIARGMEEMIRRTVGPAVQVELQLNDGNWPVMCDPNQLESALLNLCVNARDAMPQGGWLTISTDEQILSEADVAQFEEAKPGRYTVIAVSDTGIGMPPEVTARMFEPFFTTKPLGEGTGLGLSQIYGFVQQSGGTIQVKTAPGEGTTVRLCLPAFEQRRDTAGAEAARTGRTVLLVEDEPDIRELTAEQLRDAGFHVLEAASGAAAMRILNAGVRIDMLVTDVGLSGGMNGRQVMDAARQRFAALPGLLITGYAADALTEGMDVLRKPFEPRILLDMVRRKLGTARHGAD